MIAGLVLGRLQNIELSPSKFGWGVIGRYVIGKSALCAVMSGDNNFKR